MFNISCFCPQHYQLNLFNIKYICLISPLSALNSPPVQVRLRWSFSEVILGSRSPRSHLLPRAVSPPESIQTVAWGPAWTPHWGSGPPLGDQRPAENNGEPHLAGRGSLSPDAAPHLPTLSVTLRWWISSEACWWLMLKIYIHETKHAVS